MADVETGAPEVTVLAPRTVLVTRTTGDPARTAPDAMSRLYRAAWSVPGGPAGAPRARWLNVAFAPKEEWETIWAIPVANEAHIDEPDITVDVWEYGPVAQAVHTGAYDREGVSIGVVLRAASAAGYEIAGPHEEEYLTGPDAKEQRTIIRYAVRRRPEVEDG